MYVRDVFNPGDFIVPVPVGIPTTLQYDDRGVLSKVFVGYDDDKVDVSKDTLNVIKSEKLTVGKIGIEDGATWVRGVFYCDELLPISGYIPYSIQDALITELCAHPSKFTFWGGNVESLATQFKGYAAIQNWLRMSGFNVLPGWIVPSEIHATAIVESAHKHLKDFKGAIVQSYFVYRRSDLLFVSTGARQYVAKKVTRKLDISGNIAGVVSHIHDDAESSYSYSDIVRWNIQPNTLVVEDGYGTIYYTESTDKKVRERRSATIECTICGKQFDVPLNGEVMCPDEHCLSTMYPAVCHMLNALDLPVISYEQYIQNVKSRNITGIEDVLSLPEYVAVTIKTTLAKLIEAVMPVEVLRNSEDVRKFVNRCNNSFKSVQYYMQHVNKIAADLDLVLRPDMLQWFGDSYNLSTIEAVVAFPNIEITNTVRKFDGPPIFRNTTILITGEFRRGEIPEIIAILQSYDATVVTEFSDAVKFIIVGDIRNNVDGTALRLGKASNVPIYDESVFFERFEIDDDLRENLE